MCAPQVEVSPLEKGKLTLSGAHTVTGRLPQGVNGFTPNEYRMRKNNASSNRHEIIVSIRLKLGWVGGTRKYEQRKVEPSETILKTRIKGGPRATQKIWGSTPLAPSGSRGP